MLCTFASPGQAPKTGLRQGRWECVSVVCVCDNDNLTLNSSLRGAGLMLEHTHSSSHCHHVCGVKQVLLYVWMWQRDCAYQYTRMLAGNNKLKKSSSPYPQCIPVFDFFLLFFFTKVKCRTLMHHKKRGVSIYVGPCESMCVAKTSYAKILRHSVSQSFYLLTSFYPACWINKPHQIDRVAIMAFPQAANIHDA